MKTLTVQEYANLKGVSHVTVYRWIEKNKVNYTVEHLEGKDVKKVLVDNDELLSTNSESTDVSNENKYVSTQVENEDIIDSQPVSMPANDKYLELLSKMYEDNKYLSELAGQAKLLMDSEHKTKEAYFQLQQENRQLIEEQVTLKLKLEQLQENFKKSEEENTQQKELELLKDKLNKLENQKTFWDVLFRKV